MVRLRYWEAGVAFSRLVAREEALALGRRPEAAMSPASSSRCGEAPGRVEVRAFVLLTEHLILSFVILILFSLRRFMETRD